MGLDALQIVLDVEERFGIQLADSEASAVETPQDLYSLIESKVELAGKSSCKTQRSFYFLRNQLIRAFGLPRSAVKPATDLVAILGLDDLPRFWAIVTRELGSHAIPGLHLPDRLSFALYVLPFVFGVMGTLLMAALLVEPVWMIIGFVGSMALSGVTLHWTTRQYRKYPPPGILTIGELSLELVARVPELFDRDGAWTRSEIRETTRCIIGSVLGIHDFSDEAHFVYDLGI